ncbi:hypothetical protein PR202_gb12833 [Eleusine coracana subsp. coracana]|uniref:Uncharacterized protein n=1 Tax=Eleusine coracana subsp. coracana TaxID=191504 RepID=A0AAV5ENS4_ELECO|nr:hypothetical protein PR202_gb12833 [Eleusine coracana subsp. coracana]
MEQKSLNNLTLRELVQLLKTRLEVGEDKQHSTAEIEVDEVLTSELQIAEDVHELQIDDVGCSIEGNGHQIEEGEDPEVVPLRRKKMKKRKVTAAPLPLSPSRRPMACLWLCGARRKCTHNPCTHPASIQCKGKRSIHTAPCWSPMKSANSSTSSSTTSSILSSWTLLQLAY